MHFSPYSPPGFLTFGLIGLLFAAAWVFLPRRVSRAAAAYGLAAFSLVPALVSFAWVYWIHHSLARSGYTGPGDPGEIIRNILDTSLFGFGMSCAMLALGGLRTFWTRQPRA